MEIHYIQKLLLMDLALKPELYFKDFVRVKSTGIEKDLLNYHLQTLVKQEYVYKVSKIYRISNKGKKYVGNLDFENQEVETLPKVTVMVGIFRKIGKSKQVLLAKRLKAPFLGSYSLITGKIKWGERLEDTVKREVKEETGLKVNKAKLIGIRRLIDKDAQTGEVLLDPFFMMHRVDDFSGELIKTTKECENIWVDIKDTNAYNVLLGAKEMIKKEHSKWEKVAFKESDVSLGKF